MKHWITAVVAALALSAPALVFAHEGHTHKVLGTVVSSDDPHFDIKTADGKTVTIMIDADTKVTRGTEKLDTSALKDGVRVSIDAMQDKDMLMAKTIKIGAATPAKKK
jgi:hypothetical protein